MFGFNSPQSSICENFIPGTENLLCAASLIELHFGLWMFKVQIVQEGRQVCSCLYMQ